MLRPPWATPAHPRSPSILTEAPRKAGYPLGYSPRKRLQSPSQEEQTNLSHCQPNSCQIPPEWGLRGGSVDGLMPAFQGYRHSESMEVAKMTPE